MLAIDRLIDLGGVPAGWPRQRRTSRCRASVDLVAIKPVDIIGDAGPDRYQLALDALLDDPGVDAILVMNVETALASAREIAETVANVACAQSRKWQRPKPILATWIGNANKISGIFNSVNVPHYPTETDAIRGFMHVVRHGEVSRTLMETPPSLARDFAPDVIAARRLVQQVVSEGRKWLDPIEATELLRYYAIPTLPIVLASDADDAAKAAAPFLSKGDTVARQDSLTRHCEQVRREWRTP